MYIPGGYERKKQSSACRSPGQEQVQDRVRDNEAECPADAERVHRVPRVVPHRAREEGSPVNAIPAAFRDHGGVNGQHEGHRGEKSQNAADAGRQVEEVDREDGQAAEDHEQETGRGSRASLGEGKSISSTFWFLFMYNSLSSFVECPLVNHVEAIARRTTKRRTRTQ